MIETVAAGITSLLVCAYYMFAMKALAEGEEVSPIHFRDGDFWQELAEDFNRIVKRVEALETQRSEPPSTTADSAELEHV